MLKQSQPVLSNSILLFLPPHPPLISRNKFGMTLLSYLHHQTTPPLRSVVPNSSIAPLPICLAELGSRISHRFIMVNLILLFLPPHPPLISRNKFGMTLLSYLHHQTTPPLRSVVPNSSIAPLPICLAELSSRASHRFVMLNLFQHLLSTSLHKHLFSFLILPIRSRNKFGMTGRKKLSCRTRLSYLSPICHAEFISASPLLIITGFILLNLILAFLSYISLLCYQFSLLNLPMRSRNKFGMTTEEQDCN